MEKPQGFELVLGTNSVFTKTSIWLEALKIISVAKLQDEARLSSVILSKLTNKLTPEMSVLGHHFRFPIFFKK